MVTTKKIKSLDCDTIEDYFGYILGSKTNGQHKQAAELYKDLSKRQRVNFENYLTILFIHDLPETGKTTKQVIADIRTAVNTTY